MADKSTYYIAVGSGEILQDPKALNYEFEIVANEEEVERLQQLFEETSESEHSTMVAGHGLRTFSPTTNFSYKEAESLYDHHLNAIYRMLHDLGTESTKRHIESMNIL